MSHALYPSWSSLLSASLFFLLSGSSFHYLSVVLGAAFMLLTTIPRHVPPHRLESYIILAAMFPFPSPPHFRIHLLLAQSHLDLGFLSPDALLPTLRPWFCVDTAPCKQRWCLTGVGTNRTTASTTATSQSARTSGSTSRPALITRLSAPLSRSALFNCIVRSLDFSSFCMVLFRAHKCRHYSLKHSRLDHEPVGIRLQCAFSHPQPLCYLDSDHVAASGAPRRQPHGHRA